VRPGASDCNVIKDRVKFSLGAPTRSPSKASSRISLCGSGEEPRERTNSVPKDRVKFSHGAPTQSPSKASSRISLCGSGEEPRERTNSVPNVIKDPKT